MKYLSLLFAVIVFVSCKKTDNDPPPDPPGELEPIRVTQTIYTFELAGGQIFTDTMNFTYDDQGRVTSRYRTNNRTAEKYIYGGDKLISYKNASDSGDVENIRSTYYSPDGDTVVLDFLTSGNTDTVKLYYIFQNGQQTDFWTYLHFTDHDCCRPDTFLQKERWIYNGQHNVIKKTMQNPPNDTASDQYNVTAWDDKINPKYGQSKMNALALSLNVPLESFSANNPVTYTDYTGTHEIEMTYNSEGYPLAFKLKDKNYVSTRLTYNR
jgi:hypothetical protein